MATLFHSTMLRSACVTRQAYLAHTTASLYLRSWSRSYSSHTNALRAQAQTVQEEYYSEASPVPVVDISPWLANPNSTASNTLVEIIREACLTHGFFQITGHGVSRELRRKIIEAGNEFFSLPLDEKRKLDMKQYPGFRGYDAIGTQKYDDSLPDLKEGFWVGPEVPLSHPDVKARRFNMGPNRFPPADILPTHKFKEPVEQYFDTMRQLTFTILDILARTLPYGPRIFDEFVSGIPAMPMRMLHYPPQAVKDVKQFGSSAHTDFSAITLLLQDKNGGLQVQDPTTGQWIGVPPMDDAFVFNVGDMLHTWTKGLYKSSRHRVINTSGNNRLSVAFFIDGNLDCKLAPFDGSEPVGGKAMTVEEHMIACVRGSYVRPPT